MEKIWKIVIIVILSLIVLGFMIWMITHIWACVQAKKVIDNIPKPPIPTKLEQFIKKFFQKN